MKIVGTAGDRREEVPVHTETVSLPPVRTSDGASGARMRVLRIRAVEIRAVEILEADCPVPRAADSDVHTPGVLSFGEPGREDDDGTPPAAGVPGRRARVAAAIAVAAVGVAAMSTALFQTVVDSSTSLPMPGPAPAPPATSAVLAAPAGPSPAVYGDDTSADPWAEPGEGGR